MGDTVIVKQVMCFALYQPTWTQSQASYRVPRVYQGDSECRPRSKPLITARYSPCTSFFVLGPHLAMLGPT